MFPPRAPVRLGVARPSARARLDKLAATYLLGLVAWGGLRLLTRDRPWWLHLVNDFAPMVFVPTAALATGALATRSTRALLASGIAASMFAALYGHRWGGRTALTSEGNALKLMTFNLLCRYRAPDATIAAIRQVDPDIVVLQELIPGLAGPVAAALKDSHPFQSVHPGPRARGAAVFSRFPFELDERFQTSDDGWYFQEVRFEWEGRKVALFNVHLIRPSFNCTPRADWVPYDARVRASEVKRLMDRARVDDHDVILAGDFNFTDQTADYRTIRRRFRDAFVDAGRGFGFTYPARTRHAAFWIERCSPPFLRLDHIFYQGQLRPRLARVGPNGDSDHYSLVAEFVRA